MGVIEKLKLLFKIRKPVDAVIDSAKATPKFWKSLAFWITLLGSLGATVAALSGVIPPPMQLIVTTALTACYNVLRGLQKAETAEIKGPALTSELALTALGEIQKGIVAVQAGGINPEWLTTAGIIVAAAFGAGQNLAARNVTAEVPVAPVKE